MKRFVFLTFAPLVFLLSGCFIPVGPNTVLELGADTIIVADVIIDDGVVKFDNDPTTAMVVVLERKARVSFPFGGTYASMNELEKILQDIRDSGRTLQSGGLIIVNNDTPSKPQCSSAGIMTFGQTITVNPGCGIIGDIISGPIRHDDDGATFMLSRVDIAPVEVQFPFGGEVVATDDLPALRAREEVAGRHLQGNVIYIL